MSAPDQTIPAFLVRRRFLLRSLSLLCVGLYLTWATAAEYPPPGGPLTLSEEEEQFLQQHPRIRLCVDPDWEPYEKLGEHNRHVGIVAEYFALFEERSGLTIEVLPTATWAQSIDFIIQRKCDVISALNDSEERDVYLSFTAPFIREPSVLVMRAADKRTNRLADMSGMTMAVVSDYIYDVNLRLDYPEITRVYVDNIQDGLRRVAAGEIDAMIGRKFAMRYWIKKLSLDALVADEIGQYQSLLRVGVRNDYGELFLLLNRAINSLKSHEHVRIRQAIIDH